jgi:Flp pilus assembly protein TadG
VGILRSQRARGESGAAAVEFALLLPLFAMLTFGIITFGFAFERWLSVTAAAREASRFAATYPIPDGASETEWKDAVIGVAAEAADITLTGPSATPTSSYGICVSFANHSSTPGNFDTIAPGNSKRWTAGTLLPSGGNTTPCDSSSLPDNRVTVAIARDAELNWFFVETGTIVSGENTSRYEPRLE